MSVPCPRCGAATPAPAVRDGRRRCPDCRFWFRAAADPKSTRRPPRLSFDPETDAVRIDADRFTLTITADEWFELIDEARRQGLRDDETADQEPAP